MLIFGVSFGLMGEFLNDDAIVVIEFGMVIVFAILLVLWLAMTFNRIGAWLQGLSGSREIHVQHFNKPSDPLAEVIDTKARKGQPRDPEIIPFLIEQHRRDTWNH